MARSRGFPILFSKAHELKYSNSRINNLESRKYHNGLPVVFDRVLDSRIGKIVRKPVTTQDFSSSIVYVHTVFLGAGS